MHLPRNMRIGLIVRRTPPGDRNVLVDALVELLHGMGARVELVHAEDGLHRLDRAPPWDLVALKSGTAAALHVAASAESWGIPCVNSAAATRLAQDKLAGAAILQRAGLPIAPARLGWLPPHPEAKAAGAALRHLEQRPLIVKAARGSQGVGLWNVRPGKIGALLATLPPGPYLMMEHLPHSGDDLKVYVAGDWLAGVERPFPATTYQQKLGRPGHVPADVADATRQAGRLLGVSCFGCDFICCADGWRLVDVNAFPGYKGATEAPRALAAELARAARGGVT